MWVLLQYFLDVEEGQSLGNCALTNRSLQGEFGATDGQLDGFLHGVAFAEGRDEGTGHCVACAIRLDDVALEDGIAFCEVGVAWGGEM